MLLARYFTNVNMQRKLCNNELRKWANLETSLLYTGIPAPVMSLPASRANHTIRLATEAGSLRLAGVTAADTTEARLASRRLQRFYQPGNNHLLED